MHAWYETRFELEFKTKTATEFQSFFTAIMQRRFPSDFQAVKPYGKQGDKKCDGFLGSKGRVFQVYAPEQMNSATTVAKINEDLRGRSGTGSTK